MPRVPGADEYEQGDFTLLASDEYKAKILSWEEHPQPLGLYNTDPDAKTIWFKLKPLAFADDEEAALVDENGDELHPDRTLLFFYDPKRLGMVPKIARSRKFLAAALNVPIDEPIDFEGYDDLVGKEVIVSVVKKDSKNKIDDVRPVRQRKARAKTPKDAAKEVFKDEVAAEEDTEY